MGAYFSFERMITTSFVKVVYFLGFLLLTAGGIGLAVWAGLRLNDATIDRSLGWRYVAAGLAILIVGNVAWRVLCELWVVLFGIHGELVSMRYALNLNGLRSVVHEPVERELGTYDEEIATPREVVVRDRDRSAARPAGVLGLS